MSARACLLVVLALAVGPGRAAPAHAQDPGAVALLPLDAEARLEIYGQPVASEIARALVAGAVDVVVVGPKMAVPERARLIVDGKIASGKGTSVVLSIRVRSKRDGTTIEQLQATAPTLASIDRAAAELSGRVLPIVRAQLATLAPQPAPEPEPRDDRGTPSVAPAPPVAAPPRPILIAVGAAPSEDADVEPLRAALADAIPTWTSRHHRTATTVDPAALARKAAAQTVATSAADRAIAFEVLAYDVTPGTVPLARARVRVRIAGAGAVVFDRVVVTDTVVGDRQLAPARLAARVATEVLEILRPHVRRAVDGWR